MISCRPFLMSLGWLRTVIAATFACLAFLSLLAEPVHALDPNKRISQYIHTSWRTQDGSAPATDMFSIAQTSDGFLWFLASRGLYRFDGVRFVTWALPADVPATRIANIVGDRTGGLWVVTRDEIVHLKNGIVISRFELRGFNRLRISAKILMARYGLREGQRTAL